MLAPSRRAVLVIALFAVLAAAAIALRLMVGGDGLALPETAQFWTLRGQRVVAGCIVGAALAVGGVLLQSFLRNPLASPDLLGLSAGAGLGVMISIYAAYRAGEGIAAGALGSANQAAALAGSLGALGVVYALGRRRGLLDPVSLVLVGVMLSVIAGAATAFIQHLLPDRGQAAGRYLLGAISDEADWRTLAVAGGVVGSCIVVAIAAAPSMDAAALSDDEAHSLGVHLGMLRVTLFVASGLLAAAAVVLAGPIGFVGLVCPHLVRLLAGPAHRPLVIGSALAGAALIVAADTVVKGLDLASGRLPIGILTALIGGPVFIVLLRRGVAVRG